MNWIALEVYSLACGTIAKLIGKSDYDSIEAYQTKWAIWCNEHAKDCKTWQDAWFAYQEKNGI